MKCNRITISSLVLVTLSCALTPHLPARAEGAPEPRLRARELGIRIGSYPTGPLNAITDVAGVKVGHITVIKGEGPLKPGEGPARTGVTVIIPREDVWHKKVAAGSFVLNGTGEMTGLAWVAESGFLEYPIALTNTLNVPRVANGVMSWMITQYPEIGITDDTLTPVVAECDDSRLNDIQGRHVTETDVAKALDSASSGPVAEGTIGAGTGMVSYGFKGGIGSASRRLPDKREATPLACWSMPIMAGGRSWWSQGFQSVDSTMSPHRWRKETSPVSVKVPLLLSWPPTRRSTVGSLRGWPNAPPSDSREPARRHAMAAVISSWPFPPPMSSPTIRKNAHTVSCTWPILT